MSDTVHISHLSCVLYTNRTFVLVDLFNQAPSTSLIAGFADWSQRPVESG